MAHSPHTLCRAAPLGLAPGATDTTEDDAGPYAATGPPDYDFPADPTGKLLIDNSVNQSLLRNPKQSLLRVPESIAGKPAAGQQQRAGAVSMHPPRRPSIRATRRRLVPQSESRASQACQQAALLRRKAPRAPGQAGAD